jgi:hypothetical protein
VGSIQLPLAVASASCSSLKALSSEINGKISSKTEIQFVCDGSCCFHSKEMVLHGVGNFGGDLPSNAHFSGRGITGGMYWKNRDRVAQSVVRRGEDIALGYTSISFRRVGDW